MIDNNGGKRAIELGEYIAKTGCTVRDASSIFDVSKSTVHTDVAYRLKKIDYDLWEKVGAVLKENKDTRHLRGGMATREKYNKMKNL